MARLRFWQRKGEYIKLRKRGKSDGRTLRDRDPFIYVCHPDASSTIQTILRYQLGNSLGNSLGAVIILFISKVQNGCRKAKELIKINLKVKSNLMRIKENRIKDNL